MIAVKLLRLRRCCAVATCKLSLLVSYASARVKIKPARLRGLSYGSTSLFGHKSRDRIGILEALLLLL